MVLADVVPRELLRIAGDRLPARYAHALRRYRHGPGVFKLDWALDGPIPGSPRNAGEPRPSISAGASRSWPSRSGRRGRADTPSVPSSCSPSSRSDDSRAPAGKHTAWAYCHVPNGSSEDMTDRIEAQVERFAPGFRELVLARAATGPADFERRNRNIVGGDINGGALDLGQLVFRPVENSFPTAPRSRAFTCARLRPRRAEESTACVGYQPLWWRCVITTVPGRTLHGYEREPRQAGRRAPRRRPRLEFDAYEPCGSRPTPRWPAEWPRSSRSPAWWTGGLDDELPTANERAFAAHVAQCKPRRAALVALRLAELPLQQLGHGTEAAWFEACRREPASTREDESDRACVIAFRRKVHSGLQVELRRGAFARRACTRPRDALRRQGRDGTRARTTSAARITKGEVDEGMSQLDEAIAAAMYRRSACT